MESEERPTKMRKLSHGGGDAQNEPAMPLDQAKAPDSGYASGLPSEIGKDTEDGAAQDHEEQLKQKDMKVDDEGEKLPPPNETAPALDAVTGSEGDPPLSKSQQKKLRKKVEWEAKRGERKAIRKEKESARKERKREAKREAEAHPELHPPVPKKPQQNPVQLPITMVIDCDFDDLMRDNERISLAAQITRSYSDNKKSPFRAHLTICSFGGKLKERFDTVLEQNYKAFKGVRTLDCNFVEAAEKAKEWMAEPKGQKLGGVFSKYADLDEEAQEKLKHEGEVVYLSSEADEDLTELKPYSTYIIGGLVDKNREKGVCHRRATKAGVRTARLPIGEYMELQSRKVLATNHVNEIMVRWLECGDWGEAFMKVIPKRKGGSLRKQDGENDDGQGSEEVDEDVGAGEDEKDLSLDQADTTVSGPGTAATQAPE